MENDGWTGIQAQYIFCRDKIFNIRKKFAASRREKLQSFGRVNKKLSPILLTMHGQKREIFFATHKQPSIERDLIKKVRRQKGTFSEC